MKQQKSIPLLMSYETLPKLPTGKPFSRPSVHPKIKFPDFSPTFNEAELSISLSPPPAPTPPSNNLTSLMRFCLKLNQPWFLWSLNPVDKKMLQS